MTKARENSDYTGLQGDLAGLQTNITAGDTAARAGRKNLIINGGMQVAQRGMATGVVTGTYTADRWHLLGGAVSPVFTVTQGIGPTGAGKSLKYATTTTSTTTTGTTYIQVTQGIEGLNLQALAKGTSSAKSVTLSFWVKANQTGTYAVNLWDATASRQNSASYTVSAANTWEKKSIVLGPDTTGTIDNDNTVGLALNFILASGSTFTGGSTGVSAHAGNSTNYAPNQSVNVAANVGDYWEVAEVQLETGSVATDFEHRSYGEILADCQRYCFVLGNSPSAAHRIATGLSNSSTTVYAMVEHPMIMRSLTTLTVASMSNMSVSNASVGTGLTGLVVQGVVSSTKATGLTATTAGGLTAQRPYFIEGTGTNIPVNLVFDAEL
jgi:hypothetical protein